MAKLLTLLLACLPVLLLARRLPQQNGLQLTFVTDINEYRAEHGTSGVWQRFQQDDTKIWVLGQKNQDDLPICVITSPHSKQMNYLFDRAINITSVTFKLEEKNDDAQVYLVDGGIRETFVSLVVELPDIGRSTHIFTAYTYFQKM